MTDMENPVEENTRLIKLLIGKITRLEWRVNAISDCLDIIQVASKDMSDLFGIVHDDLRDEGPADPSCSDTPTKEIE